MAYNDRVGRIGIWASVLQAPDRGQRGEIDEAAAELDEFGYGALWVGGSPSLDRVEPLLAATSRVTVGTSILSIWQHTAADVAARTAELNDTHGGRFVLGLGVSHDEIKGGIDHPLVNRPYSAMVAYLDELDAVPRPVPAGQRALAALGPRMLELARDRALGALPYLVTPEHTAEARALLGPDPLLAPELKVILTEGKGAPDLETARAVGRDYLTRYLGLVNYRKNWLRLGFTEDDFRDGGSDRLLDSVFALGDRDTVRARTEEFFAAGADHVALQVVTGNTAVDVPRNEWRALAEALPLR